MNKNRKLLLQEKARLLEWMDFNDAHMSAFAVNKLRDINQQLTKVQ
tara:strand:- start:315 stop:452 length:138 start_codon:yes stop_codon:yes gene_type:complete